VLRRQQWTCGQIGAALELSAATVARVLRRCGLSRRGRLTAPLAVQRYEHAAVGDLLHVDSKKLGRIRGLGHRITGQRFHRFSGTGWEYLHVAVDDHSRVAYVELLPDEGQGAARRFLRGALRWFRAHGVRVRRILTDNGSASRSQSFRAASCPAREPSAHPSLHAPHERQSGAVHPDRAARVGVPAALLHLGGSGSGSPRLAGALQLRATAHKSQSAATHESIPRGNNLMLVHN